MSARLGVPSTQAQPLTKAAGMSLAVPIQTRGSASVTPPFGGFATIFHTEMDPRNALLSVDSGQAPYFGSHRTFAAHRFR